MNIQSIQRQKELQKVLKHTQYLTNIYKYSQSTSRRQGKVEGKSLSAISVGKTIVQLTYLLFSCSLSRKIIHLRKEPVCRPSSIPEIFDVFLIFFFSGQNPSNYNSACYQEIDLAATQRSFTIAFLKYIPQIITLLHPKIEAMSVEEENLKKKIFECKRIIEDSLISFSQLYPKTDILPQLQKKSELFWDHSDILTCFNNFLYYRIKTHENQFFQLKKFVDKIEEIKKLKHPQSLSLTYEVIDEYLDHLIEKKMIKLQKSSSKQDEEGLAIGKMQERQSGVRKYVVVFFIYDKCLDYVEFLNEQLMEKQYINAYQVEMQLQKGIIEIYYTTKIEVTIENADIISYHLNNICFYDEGLILKQFQRVSKEKEGNFMRKFIAFKMIYKLQHSEEPLTNFLFLIDKVTTYARIFIALISKKPGRDYQEKIIECQKRVQHLKNLIWGRISKSYSNL